MEEKYIPNEINTSDLIVYDEEIEKEVLEHDMIKIEVLNDTEYTMTEWIDEEKEEPQKKVKRIASIPTTRVSRASAVTPLDSADDQRIRETASMSCEFCNELLDSLRDAKSHYKLSHGTEGYIVCCDR